jgi:hypothetical protein
MDIAELMAYRYKTLRLDSGFRRRDEFEAPSLFVIPAKFPMTGSTPAKDENPPSPPFSKGGLGGI